LTGQAIVGAGLARIESERDRVATARLDTAEGLAAARGLDLTAAITELQALELTLAAAQGSFSRVYQNSLFDRLG
jgi:flagellin-like hook-associated protein FlgL